MTSLPWIVSFTGAIETLAYWSIGVLEECSAPTQYSSTPSLQFFSHRASPVYDVRLELISVFFDKRRRRHCRRVTEGANGVPHNVAADVENQIQIRRFSFAVFDPMKDFFHPVTTFATGTTLPA